MEVQFIQAWTGSSPYPEVVLSKQHLTQIALGDTSYTRGGGAKKILLKGFSSAGMLIFQHWCEFRCVPYHCCGLR